MKYTVIGRSYPGPTGPADTELSATVNVPGAQPEGASRAALAADKAFKKASKAYAQGFNRVLDTRRADD